MANNLSLLALYLIAGVCSLVMVAVFMLVLHQNASSDQISGALFRVDNGLALDDAEGEYIAS